MLAAAENLSQMEKYLPYLVLGIGVVAAGLFVAYFASETDRRKRIVGSILSLVLTAFSIFCITEGKGVKKGIDLQGGASFLVRVQPAGERPVTPDVLATAQAIIESRLNPTGGKDVVVTPQGTDRLYVEVPGLSDEEIANSKSVIERVAKLEFRLLGADGFNFTNEADQTLKPDATKMRYLGDRGDDKAKEAREPGKPRPKPDTFIWVKKKVEMQGKSVKSAYAALNPGSVNYHIVVELHSEFGDQMRKLTSTNKGRPMAIIMDNEVLSAPSINGEFGSNFEITGGFDETEARELSSSLMNPLENPLLVEQSSTISPTYGKETVQQGIYACLVGLGLTLFFMMLYYRLSGIIAVVGLIVNLLLLLGAMRVFDQTLTMPGIAGIILTLGMAIDANVLIYERLREELKAGRSLGPAINAAYSKAFSAIFDSNITTLITSIIMIVIATGAVKGFGLSLTIGLIASMFSALLITRVCFLWLSGAGLEKLSFMELIENRLYDFMGKRKLWLTISAIVCTTMLIIVGIKGQKVLGYELRGGDVVSLNNVPSATEDTVRTALQNWKVTTKDGSSLDANNVNVTTVKPLTGDAYTILRSPPATAESLKAHLASALGGSDAALKQKFAEASAESMGSAVGGEMLTKSLWALGLGLLGIFIYLTFRFEMPFAIGGIVAILHDVIIAVGVCAIAGKEIGLILIGAFLTIAGYSINDTIVIFDRVRDDLRTMKGDLKDVLNHAISATLSRTIITSGVTSLAVLAMWLFGGKSMADFSFAMLIGMLSGVYSTIFIASPVVLWWADRRKLNLRQQILDADALALEALNGLEREAPEKKGKSSEGDQAALPSS